MDFIFKAKGIGQKKGSVMMEKSGDIDDAQILFELFIHSVGSMIKDDSQVIPPNAPTPPSPKQKFVPPKDFVPATEGQFKALRGVAKRMDKTVEEICRHYGFDNPSQLSKEDARDIISELNDQTGFSEIQRQQRENDISRAWR